MAALVAAGEHERIQLDAPFAKQPVPRVTLAKMGARCGRRPSERSACARSEPK